MVSGNGGPVVTPPFGGSGGQTGVAIGQIEGPTCSQGLFAGYNWQQGNLLYGLEADINGLQSVDSVLGSARARLGFGGSNFLLYGTAGVAVVSLDGRLGGVFVGGNGGAGGNGFGTRTVSLNGTTQAGFVGGVGAEYLLSPLVGVGVEALYYAFDLGDGVYGLPDNFFTVRGRLVFYPGNAGWNAPTAAPSTWSGFYWGGHVGVLSGVSENIGSTALANGQNGGNGARGIDGGGGGGGGVAFAGLEQNGAIAGGLHVG